MCHCFEVFGEAVQVGDALLVPMGNKLAKNTASPKTSKQWHSKVVEIAQAEPPSRIYTTAPTSTTLGLEGNDDFLMSAGFERSVVRCGVVPNRSPDAASRSRTPSRNRWTSPPAPASNFSRAAYSSSRTGLGVIVSVPQKFCGRVNQEVWKPKFYQCSVDTRKCMRVGDVPTVLRQQKLDTTHCRCGDMKSIQFGFWWHQRTRDQLVGNGFNAIIDWHQRNAGEQCHPFCRSDGIAEAGFIEYELRSDNNEFRALDHPPISCLLLKHQNIGIRTRSSARVTDNRSFQVD